jgi:hypothetical protein
VLLEGVHGPERQIFAERPWDAMHTLAAEPMPEWRPVPTELISAMICAGPGAWLTAWIADPGLIGAPGRRQG